MAVFGLAAMVNISDIAGYSVIMHYDGATIAVFKIFIFRRIGLNYDSLLQTNLGYTLFALLDLCNRESCLLEFFIFFFSKTVL